MSITNPAATTVRSTLEGLCETGWRALHLTRWPGHPGSTIPHVAVGPGGVVVVLEATGPAVHGDAVDPLMEDLACAAAAVTALVSPRHRRAVRGVMVAGLDEDLPSRAPSVPSTGLPGWLAGLDPRLTPLEVVLVAAYLRDKLDASLRARTATVRIPSPSAPADAPVQESVVERPRRRWWRLGPDSTTTVLVLAGLLAPWVVAVLMHQL